MGSHLGQFSLAISGPQFRQLSNHNLVVRLIRDPDFSRRPSSIHQRVLHIQKVVHDGAVVEAMSDAVLIRRVGEQLDDVRSIHGGVSHAIIVWTRRVVPRFKSDRTRPGREATVVFSYQSGVLGRGACNDIEPLVRVEKGRVEEIRIGHETRDAVAAVDADVGCDFKVDQHTHFLVLEGKLVLSGQGDDGAIKGGDPVRGVGLVGIRDLTSWILGRGSVEASRGQGSQGQQTVHCF